MKRIVLVLGAGASHDFNRSMYLGTDLAKEIRNRVFAEEGEKYLSDVLRAAEFEPRDLQIYKRDLSNYIKQQQEAGNAFSVDDFMERYAQNPEYLKISKMMILLHVLGFEGPCQNEATFLKQTWLTELDNYLQYHHQYKGNERMKLDIVTFNYDRLLEEFIFRRNGSVVEDFCEHNIRHVYGKVSHLPWQNKLLRKLIDRRELAPFIHFGHPNYDNKSVELYNTGIDLIYERKEIKDTSFKYHILNADTVLFMGFGFDERNLQVLGIQDMKPECLKVKKWIAHVHGCHNAHVENLKCGLFQHRMETVYGLTCTEFIRQKLGEEFNS